MADALRSGMALRVQQAAAAPGADAARLTALGDLDSLGAVAKPGATAAVVKTGRRFLLVFLRPWLAMQTIFNRELARRFDESATIVRDLHRRLPLIEESMQSLDARVRAVEGGPREAGPAAPSSVAYLQRLFVHSRLPAPPATVLILPDVDQAIVSDLVSLGYTVERSRDALSDAVVASGEGDDARAWSRALPKEANAPARALVLARRPGPLGGGEGGRPFPPGPGATDADPCEQNSRWTVTEWLVVDGGSWTVAATPREGQAAIAAVMVRERQTGASAR